MQKVEWEMMARKIADEINFYNDEEIFKGKI